MSVDKYLRILSHQMDAIVSVHSGCCPFFFFFFCFVLFCFFFFFVKGIFTAFVYLKGILFPF